MPRQTTNMKTQADLYARLAAALETYKISILLGVIVLLHLTQLLAPTLPSSYCCLVCILLLVFRAQQLLFYERRVHDIKYRMATLADAESRLEHEKREIKAAQSRLQDRQRQVDGANARLDHRHRKAEAVQKQLRDKQHWLDSEVRKLGNGMRERRDQHDTSPELDRMRQMYENEKRDHLETKRVLENIEQKVDTTKGGYESEKQQTKYKDAVTKDQLKTIAGKKGKLERFGNALKQKVKRGYKAQQKALLETRSQQLAVVSQAYDQKLAEQKARLDSEHDKKMTDAVAKLNKEHDMKVAKLKGDLSAQHQKALTEARRPHVNSVQLPTEQYDALECRVVELEYDLANTNALATKMTGINFATLADKFCWSSKHADSLLDHNVGGDMGVLLQACKAHYESLLGSVKTCTVPPTPISCPDSSSPSLLSDLSDVPDDLSDQADYFDLMNVDDPDDPNRMDCDMC